MNLYAVRVSDRGPWMLIEAETAAQAPSRLEGRWFQAHGVASLEVIQIIDARERGPEGNSGRFALEPYDGLAKRRAILSGGVPVAWVDYDDVGREEADAIAEAAVAGLNRLESRAGA